MASGPPLQGRRDQLRLPRAGGYHRSSNSIAALAAALAKAQSELSNPEKPGRRHRPDRPGEGVRSFRYSRSRVGSTSSASR
jgi:hypothetical protein